MVPSGQLDPFLLQFRLSAAGKDDLITAVRKLDRHRAAMPALAPCL